MGIPFAKHPWNEIIPGLWQGGHDYRPDPTDWYVDSAIPTNEFDLVISLYHRDGYGPPYGVPHWRTRIPDGALNDSDRAIVDRAVDRALEALDAGQRVLVRCQAGYNRSGLVVALVLLARGWTADEAIAHIRRARSPWALCNEHFVGYIRERAEAGASA